MKQGHLFLPTATRVPCNAVDLSTGNVGLYSLSSPMAFDCDVDAYSYVVLYTPRSTGGKFVFVFRADVDGHYDGQYGKQFRVATHEQAFKSLGYVIA